ncbi:MAG: AEC family transporter [Clostridia bacterium]|nr:AEC family transporter [Clostridia bacterium]
MDALRVSFEVVAPLLLLMLVGMAVKAVKLIDRETFSKINGLIFYIGIPALVFSSISKSKTELSGYLPLAGFIVAATLVTFVLLLLIVPRFEKENSRRGVLVQGMLRSNDAVFGLAVAAAFAGENSLEVMAIAAALSVPLFNTLGVISLELFRGGRIKPWHTLLSIIKNPIIIAVVLGFAVRLSGLQLPEVIQKPIGHLSNMCTPLAFIVLGGILTKDSFMKNRSALTCVCIVKLLALPAVAVAVAYLLGFSGDELLAILILFGAPTAMSSFPLAARLGGDESLAGEQVAVTTALSLPTMFLFLFILQLGGIL